MMICVSIGGLLAACGGSDQQNASGHTALLASGEACNAPWASSTVYFGGHKVSYSGVNYTAAYWTQGNNPSTSNGPAGSGQPWIAGFTCGDTTSTTKATTTTTKTGTSTTTGSSTTTKATTTTTSGSSCPAYVAGTAYADGKIVANAGGYYRCLVGGWCSSGASAYEPGVGWAWTSAWAPASASSCGGTSTTAVTTSTTKASTTSTSVTTSTSSTSATTSTTGPTTSTTAPVGLLKTIHTAGRVQAENDTTLVHSWPGVYLDANFSGSGIGIKLSDSVGIFDVYIDGVFNTKIDKVGATTVWINGLASGNHTIRLGKRNETVWSYGRFLGFVPVAGGQILAPAPDRARQIEFIGDSYTVGYGNESPSRSCVGDEVTTYTNANIAFGALTAKSYNADYQINAYSGLGMVRNYAGNLADQNFRTYYDRALVSEAGNVWVNPGNWKPQVVVIGLGINDFSTPASAPWTQASLIEGYVAAYKTFIAKIRAAHGSKTQIIVSATLLSGTTDFSTSAQRVVNEMNASGDANVRYFYYDGLSGMGCHWHPSASDHQMIAQKLKTFIDAVPNVW